MRENTAWKQKQTALKELGSQGWQRNRPRHKLCPKGHMPELMEKLMMVTRIRPSPVAARLGCSTEATLSTS